MIQGLKRSTRKVKIVLLKDFENLGKKGDVVAETHGGRSSKAIPGKVRSGFPPGTAP